MSEQLESPFDGVQTFNRVESVDIQKRIGEWSDLTFGAPKNIEVLHDRAVEEAEEFKDIIHSCIDDAVTDVSPNEFILLAQQNPILTKTLLDYKKEMADVMIMLFNIAHHLKFDLLEEVDLVQSRNERRKRKSYGDGTGQHIEEDE